MSGIEIIGLIGAVVGIVQATIAVSDSIKNLKGLPEAFKEVNKRLPLVEETLSAARTQFEKEKPDDEAAAKVEPILKGCSGKTQELKGILEKIKNAKDKSALSLYRKIVLKLGKGHRVEVLMKNILEDLQILTGNQIFQVATQSQVEVLQKAIDELSQVKPSIPDHDFESAGNFQHSGKGDLNVMYGDGDMNHVKGDMYKAQTMTFESAIIWRPFIKSGMLGEAKVLREIMKLQKQGLDIMQLLQFLQTRLPRHLSFEYVMVIDARSQPLPLPLPTITSKKIFLEVLKDRFKDLGYKKIERGDWFLEDAETKEVLDLSKPWRSLMKPDRLIHMSIIFRRQNLPSTQCPVCKYETPGLPEEEVECSICGLTYRRIEEIQDINLTNETPRPKTAPVRKQSDIPNTGSKLPETFPRPRPKPQSNRTADEEIRSYKRVQVIDTKFRLQKAKRQEPASELSKATLTVQDLQDLERLAAYLADVYGLPEEEAVKIALRRRRSHSLSELRDGPEFGSHEEVPDLEAGDNMWEAFNAWKGEKEKREARPPELPAPTVTGSGSVSGGLRGYD